VFAEMGPVSEDFVESVRSSADIVDVISEYLSLKRSGQNYIGLCPFHQEKTPSFSVSPAKQIFYCFGCGVGGDVFSFLMKINNLSFPEALETLADSLGMEAPRSRGSREKQEHRERFYELNAHAAKYYHRILVQEGAAERARRYLLGRGVKKSSWERFQLGFAPDSGRGLLEYYQRNGFTLQEIRQSGQFMERYGALEERFRGRLLFPICDTRGRCLGFGGRSLKDEGPKYLNSSESPVFNKSRNLYGLHLAIPAIRDQKRVIVVEGYMDCITAQEYGFGNTVASLGTAFTQEQSRLLLRYTKDVVLAFDQDAAGVSATVRSAGLLQKLGAQVKVLDLPQAKDPDEFLRTHGKEAFAAALENRVASYLDFRLEDLLHRYNPENVVERAEIAKELLAEIVKTPNYVVREGFLQIAAQKMHTSEEALRLELSRFRSKESVRKDKTEKNRYNMEQGKQTFVKPRIPAPDAARQGLLRIICRDRTFLERIRTELGEELLFTGKLKDLHQLFSSSDWSSSAELIGQAAPGSRDELAGMLIGGQETQMDRTQLERLTEDYILTLKKDNLSRVIQAKQANLRQCEKNGDKEGIKGLLAEIHVLYGELEHLKNGSKGLA